ncbi:hypothetical protein IAD21_06365 [Abditibacteriota bacterium]|nr:hypothetical protein IAD21_06365 [Abditibacteriota bacterium]
MHSFQGQSKRLVLGVMIAGIGGGLLLVANDSRSQDNGGIFRKRGRILAPSGGLSPDTPVTPAGKEGGGVKIAPYLVLKPQKRLLLSGEGSSIISPIPSGKTYQGQTLDGEIWLNVSNEDGTPFNQAKVSDVQIETLNSKHDGGAAQLDRSMSRPGDGVWHFVLPQLRSGSHFYRITIESDVEDLNTKFHGQTIVRANYTRMPYWNAQRVDGTIWEPPK